MLPRVERRGDIGCYCKALTCQCPAPKEQSPWEKGDLDRSLATVREAHQKVLAAAAALKGDRDIEPFPPPESARGKGEIKE